MYSHNTMDQNTMELLTCRASVDTAQQSAEVSYKTGILYQAPNAGDLEGIEQSQGKKTMSMRKGRII